MKKSAEPAATGNTGELRVPPGPRRNVEQKNLAMKQVSYPRKNIIEVLRTLNELVASLDRIDSGAANQTKQEHDATLAAFIREHRIFKKAATARRIPSEPFPTQPGPDDMDELEREMEGVRYWKPKSKQTRKPNQESREGGRIMSALRTQKI